MSEIRIEATLSVERSKVWAYYTEPEHITKWNFAVPEWHCPKASNDLRVGGQYLARMEAKDGSFGFNYGGVYEEVDAPKRLAYRLGDGRKVTITFEAQGDRTRVVTVFDAEKQNPEEMQKKGWQSILNNFKTYVEQL